MRKWNRKLVSWSLRSLFSTNMAISEMNEVMKVLEEFQDVFTDVPGLTNLGKHSITLTTEEPIQ